MKKFSKINRGLILTVAVLLCLSVYLVFHGLMRNRDKKELMDITEKYIATEVKYNMLPEKYRSGDEQIPEEELTAHINNMKKDIKSYYVDNESNYTYLLSNLEVSLKEQAGGKGLIHSYTKNNIKFKTISFDKDIASVSVENDVSIDKEENSGIFPENFYGGSDDTDTITFQKVNGEWKVTYSRLASS